MKILFPLLAAISIGCSQPAEQPKAAVQSEKASEPAQAPKQASLTDLFGKDGNTDQGLPKTAGVAAKTPKNGDPIAIINTSVGRIVIKFFPEKAPNHVKNFIDLAQKHFYDGTKFHRVIPGFMIQGGDPNTKKPDTSAWGQGGPGYNVNAEFSDIPHMRGIVSMARSNDPNSAGSQFFIMHGANPSLDGKYSVFGEVLEGMDVVDKIATAKTVPQDRPVDPVSIKSVEVTKWPVKLVG